MKILAVDFDGTLAPTSYPTINKQRLIHKFVTWYVKRKKRKGWVIVLWTLRGNRPDKTEDTLDAAIQYCEEELGLTFDYVNENIPELTEIWGYSRKVSYDILIDDKNFGLMGWLLRRFDK